MLPLVEFPQIVQHYAPRFETVFSAETAVERRRLERMVSPSQFLCFLHNNRCVD